MSDDAIAKHIDSASDDKYDRKVRDHLALKQQSFEEQHQISRIENEYRVRERERLQAWKEQIKEHKLEEQMRERWRTLDIAASTERINKMLSIPLARGRHNTFGF